MKFTLLRLSSQIWVGLEMQSSSMNSSENSSDRSGESRIRSTSQDEFARIFNTAIISTHAESVKDLSGELMDLIAQPPFQAILNAARLLASEQNLSAKQATEEVIKTFRKVDQIWNAYVFLEGVGKLKSPR